MIILTCLFYKMLSKHHLFYFLLSSKCQTNTSKSNLSILTRNVASLPVATPERDSRKKKSSCFSDSLRVYLKYLSSSSCWYYLLFSQTTFYNTNPIWFPSDLRCDQQQDRRYHYHQRTRREESDVATNPWRAPW